jgi:hypothetical protein
MLSRDEKLDILFDFNVECLNMGRHCPFNGVEENCETLCNEFFDLDGQCPCNQYGGEKAEEMLVELLIKEEYYYASKR